MNYLKRFDAGLARGEAAIATVFLVAMIVAAAIQAIFRNLGGFEVSAANDALAYLAWVDPFLQKGTLWLAFLGASLATRDDRHIGIDIFGRVVPRRAKLVVAGLVSLGAGVVSGFLARAFWQAVLINGGERPAAYEVFGDSGPLHVCDATAAQLAGASAEAPGVFCAARGALGWAGVPMETPEAVLQLVVPVMFVIIAMRLLGNGVGSFLALSKPPEPDAPHVVRAEEKAG
ncbi:MAG: TRAP transporter small permease subunit [Sandaracinaceae bacterium]|nr:TRAP transporter small permease subunit [Sandaracinaceae bacterium]